MTESTLFTLLLVNVWKWLSHTNIAGYYSVLDQEIQISPDSEEFMLREPK